ncbi:hypothetical protein [Bartonella raoultii]|uniref:hypothetical protein n=1 Tax=Bartonella raoultii TaxID=1457020 RepID=UPI001ABAC0C2|nr:hypothetical protein [Bartonella raoultii]
MVRLFNTFIAATFFLSQVVNVNASHLRNAPHEEEVTNYAMEQVKDTTSTAVNVAALHVPAVSYGTTTGNAAEGKFEKVADIVTIISGIAGIGYIIGMIIGWVKDIVIMFKK